MLDPDCTHDDAAAFDRSEESDVAGHFAEGGGRNEIATPLEGGENVNAGRPRVVCLGFAVIRI